MADPLPTKDPDQAGLERFATIVFFILLTASVAGVIWLFFGFVTDFILALLFLSLFNPVYEKLLPKVRNKKWVASLLVSLLVVIVVAIPTSFLIGSLSAEAASAYESTRASLSLEKVDNFLFGDGVIARYARRGCQVVGIDYTPEKVLEGLTSVVGPVTNFLNEKIQLLLGDLFAGIYHFVMMILILFYLFIDGDRLKSFLFLLSPLPEREEELIVTQFKNVGHATLFGNGIGSLIQGVLGGIAMGIAGLPSPVLWGLVMTVFAFLPLVGIAVVTVPATIYLFAIGETVTAILFFAFCTAMGLFVENVVKTKLIGDHIQMHSLLIFLSILGGLATFNIIGILYGPLLVTLFLTFVQLYHSHYKERILVTPTQS